MKSKRHEKILELIRDNDIETQEQLLQQLQENGFNTTQATISRDIKQLSPFCAAASHRVCKASSLWKNVSPSESAVPRFACLVSNTTPPGPSMEKNNAFMPRAAASSAVSAAHCERLSLV